MRLRRIIPSHSLIQRMLHATTLCRLSLLFLAASASPPIHAQEAPAEPSPSEGAPYTLHLYARLVELPTIILPPKSRSTSLIDPQQINISLDSGHPFHPSSIRIEGNDPLSLAILLDASASNQDPSSLLPAFSKDFSPWIAGSFQPHDHLSIYSLNCDLFRAAENQPPVPTVLQAELDRAIPPLTPREKKLRSSCPRPVGLRDSIYFIMRQLSESPGRHVLLVLTNGSDERGTIPWSDLIAAATLHSVTLFVITSPSPALYQFGSNLNTLAQHSGGFFFSVTPGVLPSAMAYDVKLLRARYILQFRMPEHMTGGVHHVDVTLSKTEAIIRPSGITVPLPDKSLDHPSTDLPYEGPPSGSQPPN